MLFGEEFQEIIELISNTLSAFTTTFFLVKDQKLVLVAHHSLSQWMRSPLAVDMADAGVLALALEKGSFVSSHVDRQAYEIPYYDSEEGIKAFMAVQVDGGKGLLCVDSKRSYSFTEKHQKLLQQFSSFLGRLLNRVRSLRPKLLESGKYLLLTEMVQRLVPPPSGFEELQAAFSQIVQEMGVEEAMVLLESNGAFTVALSHGSLSTERLHSDLSIQNTPWQKVWTTGDPLVVRDPRGVPYIVGLRKDACSSLLVVPMKGVSGMLGMASKDPRGLTVEVLDLATLLSTLLEMAVRELKGKPHRSMALNSLDFFRGLETALEEATFTGASVLLVGCRVKNLEDLDKKWGLKESEELLRELQDEFVRNLGAPVCLFRGHVLMGYKVHRDRKRLEAEGKAMEKNLPLNGSKAVVRVVWRLSSPSRRVKGEDLIMDMLRELHSTKGILGLR